MTACPHSILKTLKRESNDQLVLGLIFFDLSYLSQEAIASDFYLQFYTNKFMVTFWEAYHTFISVLLGTSRYISARYCYAECYGVVHWNIHALIMSFVIYGFWCHCRDDAMSPLSSVAFSRGHFTESQLRGTLAGNATPNGNLYSQFEIQCRKLYP